MTARITPAQEGYLKRLLNEAFAKRYTHGLCLDPRRLTDCPKAYASEAISNSMRLWPKLMQSGSANTTRQSRG